ncbi:MAG: L,D-transpeptidase family protein, partial [Pseudomonadota bacterium]
MRKSVFAVVTAGLAGLGWATSALSQSPAVDYADRTETIALLGAPRLASPPVSSRAHITPLRIAVLKEITQRRGRVRDKAIAKKLNELGTFYADPDHEPVWVRGGALTPAAGELMEELGRAKDWGLEASDYDVPSAYGALTTVADQARAELDLTLTALEYAFHANGGRFDPTDLSLWYDMRPKRPNASTLLRQLSRSNDAGGVLRSLHPTHPQFVALREAYLDIIKPGRAATSKTKPAEPRVEDIYFAKGPAIRRGKRHPQIALLRKRLNVPAQSRGDETLYDREVMNAVNDFMRTQGWRKKYVFDRRVRAKLNALRNGGSKKPTRISKRSLLVNMEKWRWMPRQFGEDFHIWNNIPAFRTLVRNGDQIVHSERIIVGKTSTQTPVFNDTMTHIVFKPEWGVPSSIKIKSLLPRLAGGDYDVLRRRGMRISVNGRTVNPRSINWSKRDIRSIPIVQGAGSSNPLGRMKFMFPNKHAVYMHDTPKRHLFNTRTRTHSAGCIRVRDPQKLAEILTQETLGWTDADVAEMLARRAKSNQRVDLDRSIPVYNTYFTLVADADGKLRRYSDIYGHDKRIGQALDGKSVELIARNDPARIHNRKIARLAANIPVVRPVQDPYGTQTAYWQ